MPGCEHLMVQKKLFSPFRMLHRIFQFHEIGQVAMEDVVEQLSFNEIASEDLEEFHRQREKILAAVVDRIAQKEDLTEVVNDQERFRIARECANIFIENFYATARYRLPAAITEYLDWLRGYLTSRNFPPAFIPSMLCSVKIASHAFLGQHNSDAISAALSKLQHRETGIIGGGTK